MAELGFEPGSLAPNSMLIHCVVMQGKRVEGDGERVLSQGGGRGRGGHLTRNLPEGKGAMQLPVWGVSQVSSAIWRTCVLSALGLEKDFLWGSGGRGQAQRGACLCGQKRPLCSPWSDSLVSFLPCHADEALPFQRSVLRTQKKELKETIPS